MHGGGSVSFSSMIHEYIIREHELMEAHDQYLDDIDCVNAQAPGKISVHPCCAVVAFIPLILTTKLLLLSSQVNC